MTRLCVTWRPAAGYLSEGGTVYKPGGGGGAWSQPAKHWHHFASELPSSTASALKVQRNKFVTVMKSHLTLQERARGYIMLVL